MTIKIFNTISKKKEVFTPVIKNSVTMYVCGPTVYSHPHIGNARAAIIPDILFRVLKKNFKDDKTLVLGAEEGDILRTPGNSFMLEFSKVLSFSEKTAFIIHDKDILDFNKENLKIYFQSGNLFTESKLEKINISKKFLLSIT